MNIEYNNDLDDYINFNLIHSRNSITLKRQRILLRLITSIMLTMILLIISLFANKGSALYGTVLAIVFGALFFLIFPLFSGLGMRSQIEKIINEGKNKGVFGKQKTVIASEAITEENDAGEAKYFWTSVDKLVDSPNYIFLYVGALRALIIPRNSFANEEQYTEFVGLVEQYYSNGWLIPNREL